MVSVEVAERSLDVGIEKKMRKDRKCKNDIVDFFWAKSLFNNE